VTTGSGRRHLAADHQHGDDDITFLMVALLQNSQTRNEQAVHHKLNAIADGLSDLMVQLETGLPDRDVAQDVRELRAAIGLEEHESTSHNAAPAAAQPG
jgi:low affinity Fe/Cu permease